MRIAVSVLGFSLLGACAGGATQSEPAHVPGEPGPSQPGAAVAEPGAPAEPGAADEAPLPAGKYRIALTRRDRVGARARVRTVTNEVRSTITLEQGKVKDRQRAARKIQLEALSETLEIDADARAIKTRYVVERLEAEGPRGSRPLLPKGTTLTLVRAAGGKGTITSSAGTLSDDHRAALEAVLPTRMARTTEQQVFGSADPHGVGDSWPVDASAARAVLDEAGILVQGDIAGSTRVVEKKIEGGEECLFVLGRLEVGRFEVTGLPAGARTKQGKLRMQFSGAYPLAADRPPRKQNVQITMELSALVEDKGKKLELKIDSQKDTSSEIDPL